MTAPQSVSLAFPREDGRAAASPASPASPSSFHTCATLEDVAVRLFHLLHSPPLSLASLVRAGLLAEEEDARGRFTLVSAAPAHSPNRPAHAGDQRLFPPAAPAIAAAVAAQGQAPLASPVSASAPNAFHLSSHAHGGTTASATSSSEHKSDRKATLSSLTAQMQLHTSATPTPSSAVGNAPQHEQPMSLHANAETTMTVGSPVATLAVASPTSARAAAVTALYRPPRVSGEALARRLADLYAHHPSYALREWLHREAMRLCCPTYQDPVSNDVIATAEALRQRDALVTLYIHLYEEESYGSHAGSPTTGNGGHAPSLQSSPRPQDPEIAAWGRSLHRLMGCHHQRERHCPHRSLDGFQRPSGAGLHHTVAKTAAAPVRKAAELGGGGAAAAVARPESWPRPTKEARSVALHFVQQLLCNTPTLPPKTKRDRTLREGTAGASTAVQRATSTAAFSSDRTGPAGAAYAAQTVTFVRPPDAQRPPKVSMASAAPAAAPPPLPQRRAPPVVTSLDCMLGIEGDAVSALETAAVTTNSNAETHNAPGGDGDGDARVSGAAAEATVPARHGPRIHLRRASLVDQRRAAPAGAEGSRSDGIVPGKAVDAETTLRPSQQQHRRHHTDRNSEDSSSSSSVSLPVVGEEGEDALSLSEDEASVDEDEEEEVFAINDDGDVDEAHSTERSHSHQQQKHHHHHEHSSHHGSSSSGGTSHRTHEKGETTKERLWKGERKNGSSGVVSRQASSYQTAASTTTTLDFLTSRNGGLLSATVVAPLTAAAVSQASRLTSLQPQPPSPSTSVTQHHTSQDVTPAQMQTSSDPSQQQQLSGMQSMELNGTAHLSNPLFAGYTLTRPFTLAELPSAEAQQLLHLPHYAQAHELNRLAGLRGRSCYQDPYTNCLILTSLFLEHLPHCFGEYCKHCPHGEVCQRRQLHPREAHRRRHHRRTHKHLHPHPWRVMAAPQRKKDEANDVHWTHVNNENLGGSSSDTNSSSSGGSSLDVEDDDVDDPETIRFFEELDAADASPSTQHPSISTMVPKPMSTVASGVAASTTDVTALHHHAFPSQATPRSPVSDSPSAASLSDADASSSSSSSFSDEEAHPDEQHRHHLLRSAALYAYEDGGDAFTGNAAGVVVQVNSLRDLLLWGSNPSNRGNPAQLGQPSSCVEVAGVQRPDAVEGRANSADAAVKRVVDVEELLRRHEASFEQFNYLDYAGL